MKYLYILLFLLFPLFAFSQKGTYNYNSVGILEDTVIIHKLNTLIEISKSKLTVSYTELNVTQTVWLTCSWTAPKVGGGGKPLFWNYRQ